MALGLILKKLLHALYGLILAGGLVVAFNNCSSAKSSIANSPEPAPAANVVTTYTDFANPEAVTIVGYDGAKEDPFESPDGKYLFFDSHTDEVGYSKIYYATRVDYKTFTYVGEVQGVNFPGSHSVNPNMDLAGNFYFMTNVTYNQTGQTAYYGKFTNGTVANVTNVVGVSANHSNWMTISPEITSDGTTMYYGDFRTDGTNVLSSQIVAAFRNSDGSFTALSNSSELLKEVNATGTVLYNSILTLDGLQMVFTKSDSQTKKLTIYLAKRSSTADPFGIPQQVTATAGLVENGSFSGDGNHLYYHDLNPANPAMPKIYVVTRSKQ